MTEEPLVRLGTVTATQIVEYLNNGKYERANLVNQAVIGKIG